jgi:branched-chain amino acid aminotransferase
MTADASAFAFEPSASPVPAEERSRLIADPGFGRVFTDHMATIRYSSERGWYDPKVAARQPIIVDSAMSCSITPRRFSRA